MTDISRRVFLKDGIASVAALAIAPQLIGGCAPVTDKNAHKFIKEATEAGRYDVVVCGGGPSGFIAAIAAARQGAKTALIEKYGFVLLSSSTVG